MPCKVVERVRLGSRHGGTEAAAVLGVQTKYAKVLQQGKRESAARGNSVVRAPGSAESTKKLEEISLYHRHLGRLVRGRKHRDQQHDSLRHIKQVTRRPDENIF